MPAPLDSHNTAVRLHAVINKIIARQLAKTHPPVRYGVTETSYDPSTLKVQVKLNKETGLTPATCSPFMIPTKGSHVRVEGPDSDLFVTHVMRGSIEPPVITPPTDFSGIDGGAFASANLGLTEITDGGPTASSGFTDIIEGGSSA